jgi:hypothetical protein
VGGVAPPADSTATAISPSDHAMSANPSSTGTRRPVRDIKPRQMHIELSTISKIATPQWSISGQVSSAGRSTSVAA